MTRSFWKKSISHVILPFFLLFPSLNYAKITTLIPNVLTVGTYFVNPPFEFILEGKQVGFDVDLIHEIGHRLGLKINFINTTWENSLNQIKNRKFDAVIGAITITAARKKEYIFSIPYMNTTLSIITDKEKNSTINSLHSLKNATIGVQAETTDVTAAKKMQQQGLIAKIKIYPFSKINTAITDIKTGKINAVMKVTPVAEYFVEKNKVFRIVAEVTNDPQPLGIEFNHSNSKLAEEINLILIDMKRDGSYEKICKKWFGNIKCK